jgi:outer membrane lipoprotein-sorting protein
MRVGLLGLLSLSVAAPLRADSVWEFEPAPEGVGAQAVAVRAANAMHSDRTYTEAEMTIGSSRDHEQRVVSLQSWDDRVENRSFIRILPPGRDAGTAFLKLPPNIWGFLSREERTLRIQPSMMLQSWMGSGFTNDDFLNPSSAIEDYDHTLLGVDPNSGGTDGLRAYVVEYRPRETGSALWGKILGWFETETGTLIRQEFYDGDGENLRTIRFGDVREVDGRRVPHVWTLTTHGKKDRQTTIEIHEIRFDERFDDDIFSTRNLKAKTPDDGLEESP